MPFTQEDIQFNQVSLHLLKFREFDPKDYLDLLTEDEIIRLNSFSHPKRKIEFAATRILRHRLFGNRQIHYDMHGAPYIDREGYISISHAPGIVGISLSMDFKVGLDLELIQNKALRLQDKFLSEDEKMILNLKSNEIMTKAWSVKEVLYKLAGRKQIIFKKDLRILDVDHDTWICSIINPDQKINTEISTFIHEGTVVSLNKTKCNYDHNTH